MEEAAYHALAAVEESHWWHRGRREILRTLLERFVPNRPVRIAEIGCGTGGNLGMLREFGPTVGVESSPTAIAYSKGRRTVSVLEGQLPDRIPLSPASYDCVCLLDVLEHLDDDVVALRACRELLAPGGRLILTVPAYPWLWSIHDAQQHHRRRYTRRSLLRSAAAAGVAPLFASHFNTWLLAPAVAARVWDRFRPATAGVTGLKVPSGWLNTLLFHIFRSESWWLRRGALPVGLSICAVLEAAPDNA